jgi:hypothetical protein
MMFGTKTWADFPDFRKMSPARPDSGTVNVSFMPAR